MTALQALFNGDAPKKNAGTTPSNPQPAPAASTPKEPKKPKKNTKKQPPMKVCTKCGEEVYAMQTKDGICNTCRKGQPKAPKASAPKSNPTKSRKTKSVAKSDGRKKGLDDTKWHGKEATFPQTKRLKTETGLKTWGLDIPLTRVQASTMISTIVDDGVAGVEAVKQVLIEKFGCEKYVRPSAKVKAAPKESQVAPVSEPVVENDDMMEMMRQMREELDTLKASNRGLKSANTRLKNKMS